MAGNRAYDVARQRAVILYVLQRCGPMDIERLATLLYLIDFEAYAQLGQSITGDTYVHMPDGWGRWPRWYLRLRDWWDGWRSRRLTRREVARPADP